MRGARIYYSNPRVGGRDRANWEWCGFLKPQSPLKLHTSQSKTTPPNPSQTVPPDRGRNIWINKPIEAILIQSTTSLNCECTNGSIHWFDQSPHDPTTSLWLNLLTEDFNSGVFGVCTVHHFQTTRLVTIDKASLRVSIMMVTGFPDTCCGLARWIHLTQSCAGQQAHHWSLELGPKWEKLWTHSEKL